MSKLSTFRDRVKITAFAGNGGNGLSSFRREKFVPFGGPDGGDGGRGGHVLLRADVNVDSLQPLYFKPLQRAGHGGRGGKQRAHGRNGEDLVVSVPCGTEAFDFATGDIIGEVVADGEELYVAHGGKGGIGNCHFTSSTHQAPTEFTNGELGEEVVLRLELKMVADVGLVGYPNAGKSTLLRALTAAHPKVASYPFTTLHPMIGTLIFKDFAQIKVADIPGLIDGAAMGVGLGHEFLRHIERTRLLVFVIDMAGTDGRNPADDFENLRGELKAYNKELPSRRYLVVANKMDAPDSTDLLKEFIDRTGEAPMEMAAEIGEGLEPLKQALHDSLRVA